MRKLLLKSTLVGNRLFLIWFSGKPGSPESKNRLCSPSVFHACVRLDSIFATAEATAAGRRNPGRVTSPWERQRALNKDEKKIVLNGYSTEYTQDKQSCHNMSTSIQFAFEISSVAHETHKIHVRLAKKTGERRITRYTGGNHRMYSINSRTTNLEIYVLTL